ncbi:MAG: hypothetical protein HGA85_08420, partial [Nanoarchaeota archaeon]|nr:hypothetical protein [Nanoarchaeota archaeon]
EKHNNKDAMRIWNESAENDKDNALRQLMKTLEAVNDKLKEFRAFYVKEVMPKMNAPAVL